MMEPSLPRDFQKGAGMNIVERLRAGTPWSNPVAGMCVSLTEDANKTMREAADTIEALAGALNLADKRCGSLPHNKNQFHDWDEPCPVEEIINAALRRVEEKV